MTNNQLTAEQLVTLQLRIMSALSFYRQRPEKEARRMAELLELAGAAASELQERSLTDKNYFMYGIANPDGMAHMDEFCVSSDMGLLEAEVAALNSSEGTDGYRVVALYTALPLTDAERAELQEYRKADAELKAARDSLLQPEKITCERCGRTTTHPEGWHYCHGGKDGQ